MSRIRKKEVKNLVYLNSGLMSRQAKALVGTLL